jgi:hypothetical protein
MRNLATDVSWTATAPKEQTSDYVLFELDAASLRLKVDLQTEQLVLEATLPDKNYFAIGFGQDFQDTDTLMFSANGGRSSVTDMWSKEGVPKQDTN